MNAASPLAEPSIAIQAAVDDLTTRAAIEWRRERDRREPLKRDPEGERKRLVRDFIVEALTPAARDLEAVFLSLENEDDIAAAYHFKCVLAGVKAAAGAFKDLGAQ